MKGDQRNAALKVMLVSCPCHQNGPVFFHQLTNFTFPSESFSSLF